MRTKNLNSIGVRQFFSIFILFLAMGVIFFITSLELSRFEDSTQDLVEHHLHEVRLLGKLESLMLQIKIELEDIALNPEPHRIDFFHQQVKDLKITIDQILAKEAKFPDELTSEVTETVNRFNKTIKLHFVKLIELKQQGLIVKVKQKAQSITATIIDSILADCAGLVQMENDEVLEFAHHVEMQSASARTKIIAISSIVILLSSVIALLLAYSITKPISHLASVAENVSAGNLSLRSCIEKKDEIGLLSRAFDNMVANLESLITEQKLFLTDTSHELLTPVTVIKGHLQVFGRNQNVSPKEQEETFSIVFSELHRIERIINDLQDLARSSSRDLLNLSEIDLSPFLVEIFKKVEVLGQRNWHLGEIPELKINADYDLLSRALLNLLRNAVSYTKETDKISLTSNISDDNIRFIISDSGKGIEKEDIPRIFERFYRGSNSSIDNKTGSGLGLSIVKSVAQVHGGGVYVKSTAGSGSTFYLSIPL